MLAVSVIIAFSLFAPCLSYPGMSLALSEIQAKAASQKRQEPVLIGDLATEGPTTDVGQEIADILLGKGKAQDLTTTEVPTELQKRILDGVIPDPCSVWYNVSQSLTELFLDDPTGECNDNARAAVRTGFHDAGTWSLKLSLNGQPNGGADGSFLMDFGEETRSLNNGLQNIRQLLQGIATKHKVGYADLAQFAHNHATVTCPMGPRIKTFVGRTDATQAAPDGLLPDAFDTADNLLALFLDKTFRPGDLAALLGAHSTSKQRFHNPARAEAPQDTTPGLWDVAYYNETLQTPPDPRIQVIKSDPLVANHPLVAPEWSLMIGNQQHWNENYALAWIRMSLLGVTNINGLAECTRALPLPRNTTGVPGVFG